MIAWWLAPIMLVVSILLLGRAHYVLYILKRGTAMTTIITWVATCLVIGFWGWKLFNLESVTT